CQMPRYCLDRACGAETAVDERKKRPNMRTCEYFFVRIAVLERKNMRNANAEYFCEHRRQKHIGHHCPDCIKVMLAMENCSLACRERGEKHFGYVGAAPADA